MEEEMNEKLASPPHSRLIGGSRVVLVRRYEGTAKPLQSPPKTKRCLLERVVELNGSSDESDTESPSSARPDKINKCADDELKVPTDEDSVSLITGLKKRRASSREMGILGGGALLTAAAIGLWFYSNNGSE